MHNLQALALFIALPSFITDLSNPVKIVALAAAITPTLQLLKRFMPNLSGWYAVAVNILLSAAGMLAVTPPDQILTTTFFVSVISTALGAAGIHGTATLTGNQGTLPAPTTGTGQAANVLGKSLIAIVALALAVTGLTGCTDWERSTYQTLSASKAVIDQAQTDYEARTIPRTIEAYTLINEAKAAQTLAAQAGETYEEIKYDAKAAPGALAAQQAIVNTALAKLPALIAAVKGLYLPKPAPTPAPIAKPATSYYRPSTPIVAFA